MCGAPPLTRMLAGAGLAVGRGSGSGTEAGGVCWLQVVVRRGLVVGLQCVRVRGGVVTWGGLASWWWWWLEVGWCLRCPCCPSAPPSLPLPLSRRAATLELVAEKQGAHDDLIRSVAISPDGKTIVSGSDDKALKLWNAGARRWHVWRPPSDPHAGRGRACSG